MSYDEKNAWAFLITAVAAYAVYVGVVLFGAAGGPLVAADYAPVLLWTVGGAIVANIILSIPITATSPTGRQRRDQRDREIKRFGDTVGQSFVIIGAVAALLLALLQADTFWIANAVYLAFVLSAVVGSIARVVAYRTGVPTW